MRTGVVVLIAMDAYNLVFAVQGLEAGRLRGGGGLSTGPLGAPFFYATST